MYVFRRYGWGVTYRAPVIQEQVLETWSALRSAVIYSAATLLLFFSIVGVLNLRQASKVAAETAAAPEKTSAPSPAAILPPIPNASEAVQTILNNWNASHPTRKWSVVVNGLNSDQTSASINSGNQFATASIYKLLLTYPLFQTYSLDDLSKTYVGGKGSLSLKSCVEMMIKISDNNCGEAVGYKLGWTKATNALQGVGLTSTNLYSRNGPVTTADDVALFLKKFYAGELMDNTEKQYIMSLMQQQKYRSGIPSGCGSCVVSDKIGDLGFVRHDAGILEYNGGAFALTVLTNGASYSQIAELTAQVYSAMVSH